MKTLVGVVFKTLRDIALNEYIVSKTLILFSNLDILDIFFFQITLDKKVYIMYYKK